MDITIRPMTVEDTRRVGEVHVRAWQSTYRGAMPDEFLDGLRPEDRAEMWRQGVDEAWPGQRDVIVADGRVAGFAAYGPAHGGGDDPLGELYAINLDPDYWRQGLGRRLIRHVTSELVRLGFPRAVLWVEATNDRARRFYEVEGWHFDGTEQTDTIDGVTVDEVRYARDLPSCVEGRS